MSMTSKQRTWFKPKWLTRGKNQKRAWWQLSKFDDRTVEWLGVVHDKQWLMRHHDGDYCSLVLLAHEPTLRRGKLIWPRNTVTPLNVFSLNTANDVWIVTNWYATTYLPKHDVESDELDRVGLAADLEGWLKESMTNVARFGNPCGYPGGRLG